MKLPTLAALLVTTFAIPAYAQQQDANRATYQAAQAKTDATLSDGEVRKVDKDAKKITIRHGPLVNLDMPAMTMVFQVKDPAMLDTVNAGDKIRFTADKIGGAFTVIGIDKAK